MELDEVLLVNGAGAIALIFYIPRRLLFLKILGNTLPAPLLMS